MYELLHPLPPKQPLESNTNCGTNNNIRTWKGFRTNLADYCPGTSGFKKDKQDYGQQGTKYDNHNKKNSKVVQMEECFSKYKILLVTATQAINMSNSDLFVL